MAPRNSKVAVAAATPLVVPVATTTATTADTTVTTDAVIPMSEQDLTVDGEADNRRGAEASPDDRRRGAGAPAPYSTSNLFYAHTTEAYIFKNLIEVLQNNLRDVCFSFSPNGISLMTVDSKNEICVNLLLSHKKFDRWHCDKSINVGINLQQFYKMIKSIKKKDVLTLYITRDKTTQLSIKKCPNTGNKNPDISHVTIQSLQVIETTLPETTRMPHNISTADFQKAVKEMSTLSKTINVQSNETLLTLSFVIDGLCGKTVELDQEPSAEDPETGETPYDFEEAYVSKTLSQFIKISGLNAKMRVYAEPGVPLKLEIDVGSLGLLAIYIKSRSQLE
jgi:proliferating cell nuclear antigen PCNA